MSRQAPEETRVLLLYKGRFDIKRRLVIKRAPSCLKGVKACKIFYKMCSDVLKVLLYLRGALCEKGFISVGRVNLVERGFAFGKKF